MPEHRRRPFSILELIRQLTRDAVDWSNDEMALTKLDAKAMVRRYLYGLGLMLVSFAILIAAIFTLAQTVIGALAEYLHGHVIAGLVVSFILFVVTVVLIMVARYLFTNKLRPKGIIFRRLLDRTPE